MIRNLLHRAASSVARALSTRSYAAARVNRLNSSWITSMTSADEELWQSLRELRARSRALARDDDYFKNYIRKVKNNVIGPHGMTMKVEAQLEYSVDADSAHGNSKVKKDRTLNKTVENAWFQWCKKQYASVSEKLSFVDQERLCIESVVVDGEAIFRKIYGRNAFGYTLQQIDPDWLDENYNEKLENGNRIVMSVEMDSYDRVVFYHFTPPRHSYYGVVRGHGISSDGKRVKVPANEIIHCFIHTRPGQTRGVPFAHTVIARIRDLDRYEEAEVVNAIVSASKMGFVMPDAESPTEYGADIGSNGEFAKQVPILDKVEPGIIQKLPAGWKFEQFDPKSPTTVFATFCKQILRGIGAGLGISYNLLTGDLEGVNYSSLRSAALDERDEWRALQKFMIEHFYEPVYSSWIAVAIGSPFLSIPYSAIQKVQNACFKARGWAWVDPEKDAKANALELESGMATYSELLAEKGIDFEDHIEQIKYERGLIKEAGLEFSYGGKQPGKEDDGSGKNKNGKSDSASK